MGKHTESYLDERHPAGRGGARPFLATMIPAEYRAAKERNDSQEQRSELVAAICLEALRKDAALKGLPAPTQVAAGIVAVTLDMYEHAFSLMGKSA